MTAPSVSPWNLLQEQVARDRHYPWRVTVSCALLNRTTGTAAHRAAGTLFMLWPSPDKFLYWVRRSETERLVLRDVLQPLGLAGRREQLLERLTEDYLAGTDPAFCRGVGEYGRDAIEVFCKGNVFFARELSDTYLARYVSWRVTTGAPAVEWDEVGYIQWLSTVGEK